MLEIESFFLVIFCRMSDNITISNNGSSYLIGKEIHYFIFVESKIRGFSLMSMETGEKERQPLANVTYTRGHSETLSIFTDAKMEGEYLLMVTLFLLEMYVEK